MSRGWNIRVRTRVYVPPAGAWLSLINPSRTECSAPRGFGGGKEHAAQLKATL